MKVLYHTYKGSECFNNDLYNGVIIILFSFESKFGCGVILEGLCTRDYYTVYVA